MLGLFKNYIKEEEAIEMTIPMIIIIVIGIAVCVVIGVFVYNAINSGKTQGEDGLSEFDGLVNDINGLR